MTLLIKIIRKIVPSKIIDFSFNLIKYLLLKYYYRVGEVGWKTSFAGGFKIFNGAKNIRIGKNVSLVNALINAGNEDGKVIIEDNVVFAHDVAIISRGHDYTKKSELRNLAITEKPITIKEGAWIGTRAIVLGGVTVGRNAVVGAGSVVTKDIEDDTISAGNPAKVIKKIVYQENSYNNEYYNTKYFEVRHYQDLDLFLKRMIRGLLPVDLKKVHNAKALDVACGVGIYCKFLGSLGLKEVHGVDFSEDAINSAKENFPKGKFVIGDSKNLPYQTNTFDLILNAHMVEHFTDQEILKFMKESLRVLRPGGKILLITPNGWCPNRFLFPKVWFYDPSHINFSSPVKLAKMLKNVGFSTTKIKQELFSNNGQMGKYVPPKGYYGLSRLDELLPGIFEYALTLANNFPFVLFRDVAYVSATK
ncbi:MAG: methyltransferase domain-containing protein [Patescibacteria group bacterium]